MAESWIALMTRMREVGWTSKLKGGPFAAWIKFLMTVKDRGKRGGTIRAEYLDSDWLRKNNVTLAHWSTMLAAAVDSGAVTQENGVFTVAKWAEYQRDPTNAKRQDRWRDRQDEKDVTLHNGSNGDSTGQDSTGQDKTTPLPPVLDTPAFKKVWLDWEQHRKEIRHALKPTTWRAQLRKLAKVAGASGVDAAVAMIQQSIDQGWQGLFEVKSDRPSPGEVPQL